MSVLRKARGSFVANATTTRRAFLLLAVSSSLTLTSCATPRSDKSIQLSQATAVKADNTLGCSSAFEDTFFDALYDVTLAHETFASPEQMQEVFDRVFAMGRLAKLQAADRMRVTQSLTELYRFLTIDAVTLLVKNPTDSNEVLSALTSIETGDLTSPQNVQIQNHLQTILNDIEQTVANSGELPACVLPEKAADAASVVRSENLMANTHPAVLGALKALAVGYQSCSAATRAPLNSETPNIRGITITGQYPNSPGMKRQVTNLPDLLDSHPYLKNYLRPASNSCFNVTKNPMIYDYGGKPSVTTGANAELDFFSNYGGTSVLGIDCSGYVFSSLATAGLRLSRGKTMKPVFVHTTNAAKFMNPKQSGFTCFDRVAFKSSTTIVPGDILASSGHIFIIDTVGDDPFGVNGFTNISQCVPSNMSSRRFHFTLLQSASTKGGIGINRIQAAGFLDVDEIPMDHAMNEYAVAACRARLTKTTVSALPSEGTLIRHSDSSDCTDRKIKLTHEECVTGCSI